MPDQAQRKQLVGLGSFAAQRVIQQSCHQTLVNRLHQGVNDFRSLGVVARLKPGFVNRATERLQVLQCLRTELLPKLLKGRLSRIPQRGPGQWLQESPPEIQGCGFVDGQFRKWQV